jgi:hypothetical protein
MMTVFLTIKHEPLNLREGWGLYRVGPLKTHVLAH